MATMRWGLAAVTTVAAVAALARPAATTAATQRAEPLPKALVGVGITEHPGVKIPLDLQFTAEDGRPVLLSQYFDGRRPVILTLNYYRCPMLCGLLLNGLVEGLKGLAWTPGKEFEVVTLSIDPLETHTLAMLKKESILTELGRPGAAAGWHFLTGEEKPIRALADAVGFGYRYDRDLQQYAHPAGIFILTPDGRTARVLYGVAFEPRTLKLSLAEASEGKVTSTADQILLFCYHYDASSGRYVLAANNIMRAGGVATALLVGVWLAAAWRRSAHQRTHARLGADAPGR